MRFLTSKILFLGLAAFLALVGCSNKSSQLTPKPVVTQESVTQKPTDLVSFNPKVDILFVIDNSGSMSEVQNNLSRNLRDFSNAITNMSVLDYHIGVTSTDMDTCSAGCGNLIGRPLFIDKTTPNAAAALSKNMLLGISGSGTEQLFTPVVQALSLNNGGFYRQDAYLAVIMITDANDQSTMSPADLLKYLISKKLDPAKVLAYGVIRKLAEQRICPAAESLDSKIEDFLASVVNADKKQNNVLSLCSTDYGVKLAQFAADIVKRSAGVIRLARIPDAKTIKVTYGTQIIANDPVTGWIYEVSTNSILLSPSIKFIDQGPNVGLSVDFEAIETK